MHAIRRQSPLMQSAACIIYTLECISKAYEDPGRINGACLLLSCRYICCMLQHLWGIFSDEIPAVLSNSQCIYSFHSLHTPSSLICPKCNAEDKAEVLSYLLSRGQFKKFHSITMTFSTNYFHLTWCFFK